MKRFVSNVLVVCGVLALAGTAQAASQELWVVRQVNPGETGLTQRYELDGDFLTTLVPGPPSGSSGRGAQLGPGGVMYIANTNAITSVQRFDIYTQGLLGSFGVTGGATDVGFDSAGNLYVSNQFHKVYKGAQDGTGLVLWAGVGLGSNSAGMAVAPDGTIFLGDNTDSVVRKYDSAGVLQATFSGNGLSSPRGVELGPDGKIYVANGGGKISRFLADGTADGNFDPPGGALWNLAFAPNGKLYVVHILGTQGIEIIDPVTMTSEGVFPANFGANANDLIWAVEFTPEPATLGLLVGGALMLVRRWR